MNIEHHRTFTGQAGRPDVHLEHILALPTVGPLLKECLLARPVMQALRTIGSIGQGGVLALPRRWWLGREPPVLARRFRDRRSRRGTAAWLLASSGFAAFGRVSISSQHGAHTRGR